MTGWTKEDTEALRGMEPCGGYVGCHPDGQDYVDANALLERAADQIERLQARVAELEQSDLEAFVVEHLPYQLDDGTGDDANAEECVEYAADELRKRRKRIAALEAANRELRVLCEDSRRHADEEIAGLRGRIDTLEAERGTLVARVAGLEAKLADYKAGAEAEARAGDDARARVRILEAELAATIPRATLVSALRERAAAWERRALAALTSPQASAEERLMDHKVLIVQRVECLTLADEIERGEWPKEPGND